MTLASSRFAPSMNSLCKARDGPGLWPANSKQSRWGLASRGAGARPNTCRKLCADMSCRTSASLATFSWWRPCGRATGIEAPAPQLHHALPRAAAGAPSTPGARPPQLRPGRWLPATAGAASWGAAPTAAAAPPPRGHRPSAQAVCLRRSAQQQQQRARPVSFCWGGCSAAACRAGAWLGTCSRAVKPRLGHAAVGKGKGEQRLASGCCGTATPCTA